LFDRFYDEEVMVVTGYEAQVFQVKAPIASACFRFSSLFTW
jgi:hypothetical protein